MFYYIAYVTKGQVNQIRCIEVKVVVPNTVVPWSRLLPQESQSQQPSILFISPPYSTSINDENIDLNSDHEVNGMQLVTYAFNGAVNQSEIALDPDDLDGRSAFHRKHRALVTALNSSVFSILSLSPPYFPPKPEPVIIEVDAEAETETEIETEVDLPSAKKAVFPDSPYDANVEHQVPELKQVTLPSIPEHGSVSFKPKSRRRPNANLPKRPHSPRPIRRKLKGKK